jgi:hypothetical protein
VNIQRRERRKVCSEEIHPYYDLHILFRRTMDQDCIFATANNIQQVV